jgi:hypothetical protein
VRVSDGNLQAADTIAIFSVPICVFDELAKAKGGMIFIAEHHKLSHDFNIISWL